MPTTLSKIDLKRNDYTGHAQRYDQKRFAGRENEYLELLRRRAVLKAFAGCKEEGTVLDVGCGTGRGLAYLATGKWQGMIGLDYTRAMLGIASSNLRAHGAERSIALLQGDAFGLPFPDRSVSAVMSLNFLHMFHFKLQKQLIDEMVRVCRPGGVVVVEFESIHKGLFISRYAEQRRLARRTKFNSAWEIKRLFPNDRFSCVRVYGTALPVAYRFLSFAPRVGWAIETIGHWGPIKWLCERVIVAGTVRGDGRTERTNGNGGCT